MGWRNDQDKLYVHTITMGEGGRSTISDDHQAISLGPALRFLEQFPTTDIVVVVHNNSTDSGCVLYDEVVVGDELVAYSALMSTTIKRYLGEFWDKVLVGHPNQDSRRMLINLTCGSTVTQERARLDLEGIVKSLSLNIE